MFKYCSVLLLLLVAKPMLAMDSDEEAKTVSYGSSSEEELEVPQSSDDWADYFKVEFGQTIFDQFDFKSNWKMLFFSYLGKKNPELVKEILGKQNWLPPSSSQWHSYFSVPGQFRFFLYKLRIND